MGVICVSIDNENIGKVHLRHEAEALKLSSLSISQINAFSALSALLLEALRSSGSKKSQAISRIAILSGQKGTGKSSVMLTMQQLMSNTSALTSEIGNLEQQKFDSFTDSKIGNEQIETFKKLVDKDHIGLLSKIHWLQPMSMDPWPDGSNFLGGVFARLDSVIGNLARDAENSNRFQRDGTLATNTARQWFRNLRNNAVTAQEGNLSKIANTMMPDAFAIQVNENEDNKSQMNKDLEDILSEVINPYENGSQRSSGNRDNEGIFVVVIDDVDLRPAQAAKALKLAHAMSNSRLFFLFLGDIEALDTMLFYEVQGEFVSLLEHPPTSVEMDDIEARSNEIASSVVRKLIPWNQRIRIHDMTIDEALHYTIDTGISTGHTQIPDGSLSAQLYKLPVYRNKLHSHDNKFDIRRFNDALSTTQARKPENEIGTDEIVSNFARSLCFYNFFDAPAMFDTTADKGVTFYDGANILAVAPRHVGDFFHAMEAVLPKGNAPDKNIKQLGDNYGADRLIDALNSTFRSFVNEDGYLTVPVQDHLKSMLEKHSKWELNPRELVNVPIIGDSFELMHDRNSDEIQAIIGVKPHFGIGKIIRNDIECKRTSGENVKLNPRSRPALKILHDFLKFTGEGVVVSAISSPNIERHMNTEWHISEHDHLKVSWKISEWPTYWHQDFFGAIWNQFFDCITNIQRQPSNVKSKDLNRFFVYSWISTTITTLNAQPGLIVHFVDKDKKGIIKDPPKFSFTGERDDNTIGFLFDQIKQIDEDGNYKKGEIILENLAPADLFEQHQGKSKDITKKQQKNIESTLIYQFATILDRLFRRVTDGEEDDFTRTLQTKICEIICLAAPEIGVFIEANIEEDKISSNSIEDPLFSEIFELISDPIKYYTDKLQQFDPNGERFRCLSEGETNRTDIDSITYDIWAEIADIRMHRLAGHIGVPLVFEMAASFAEMHKSKKFEIYNGKLNIEGTNPGKLDNGKLNAIPTPQQLRNAVMDWISFCPKTLVNQLGLHYCTRRLFTKEEHDIMTRYNEQRFFADD